MIGEGGLEAFLWRRDEFSETCVCHEDDTSHKGKKRKVDQSVRLAVITRCIGNITYVKKYFPLPPPQLPPILVKEHDLELVVGRTINLSSQRCMSGPSLDATECAIPD